MTYYFYTGKKYKGRVVDRKYRLPLTFQKLLSEKGWTQGQFNDFVAVSDLSEKSLVKQYLDGLELLYLKHEYAKINEKYNPKTYVIQNKHRTFANLPKFRGQYFLKLSTDVSGGGKGLYVVSTSEDLMQTLKEVDPKGLYKFVLQKAIQKPITMKSRKIDFRLFGLVSNFSDIRLNTTYTKFNFYCYKIGLIRKSVLPFDMKSTDLLSQATNSTIAEDHLNKRDLYDQTLLFTPGQTLYKKYFTTMESIMADTFDKVEPNLDLVSDPSFVLLGYDFVVSENGQVYLIEVNRRPSLYDLGDFRRKILHKNLEDQMIPDLYELTLKHFEPGLNKQGPRNMSRRNGWTLLT